MSSLREQILQAAKDLRVYRDPDVDDVKYKLSDIINAYQDSGSIRRDNLTWLEFDEGDLIINVSYGVRGSVGIQTYRIPEYIIDAPDPIKTARIAWAKNSVDIAEQVLRDGEALVVRYRKQLDKATSRLAELEKSSE